jgi:type III secretion protein J
MKRTPPFIHFCCLCCIGLLLSACNSKGAALLNGLPEDEANTIVAALTQSGFIASKTIVADGMANIYVSGDNQSAALAELHQRGLPRQNYASLGDIFKKDGIISTPLEEQARYVYALAQELEKTLSQLDGIVYVRVHPVLARKASLGGPAASASAGVLIKHRPDADLAYLTPQIQELVAHSIPDLRAEQVSIIMAVAEQPGPAFGAASGTTALRSDTAWWLAAGGLLVLIAAGGVYYATHYAIRKRRSGLQNQAGHPLHAQPESLEFHE